MSKPPAFQFYADDFLAGTADMTAEEVGAYILLLCHQWNRGTAPTDAERQRLLARCEVTKHVLDKFEQLPDGRLCNARLERERQKQEEFRAKQSQNGQIGMAKRWHNQRYNGAITTLLPKHNSPSPSPSPVLSHTSAEIPTIADVLAIAEVRGVTKESATAFFNHHENNQLWVNQFGRLINWQAKLITWAANDRQPKTTNASNRSTRPDRAAGTFNAGMSTDAIKSKVL